MCTKMYILGHKQNDGKFTVPIMKKKTVMILPKTKKYIEIITHFTWMRLGAFLA